MHPVRLLVPEGRGQSSAWCPIDHACRRDLAKLDDGSREDIQGRRVPIAHAELLHLGLEVTVAVAGAGDEVGAGDGDGDGAGTGDTDGGC